MTQVVPAILEKTWEDIQKKVKRIRPFTNFVQLDVMDDVFVPNETYRDTAKLSTLDIDMEVHLMIDKPELFISKWALPNVKRMIVHYEAVGNVSHVIELIHRKGKEAAVAINPHTSTYEIREFIPQLDMIVVMGVEPGFSGQQFQYDVLEKIKEIKKVRPDVLVEVDGGVNGDTARSIREAGADILAAASFIWNAQDIAAALATLKGE